jgi:hypothetical protein
MVSFQTENPNLGIFLRTLEWKMFIYLLVIWNILRTLGIFLGILVILVIVIWHIFPLFGILHQEKSGNPALVPAIGGKKKILISLSVFPSFFFSSSSLYRHGREASVEWLGHSAGP